MNTIIFSLAILMLATFDPIKCSSGLQNHSNEPIEKNSPITADMLACNVPSEVSVPEISSPPSEIIEPVKTCTCNNEQNLDSSRGLGISALPDSETNQESSQQRASAKKDKPTKANKKSSQSKKYRVFTVTLPDDTSENQAAHTIERKIVDLDRFDETRVDEARIVESKTEDLAVEPNGELLKESELVEEEKEVAGEEVEEKETSPIKKNAKTKNKDQNKKSNKYDNINNNKRSKRETKKGSKSRSSNKNKENKRYKGKNRK